VTAETGALVLLSGMRLPALVDGAGDRTSMRFLDMLPRRRYEPENRGRYRVRVFSPLGFYPRHSIALPNARLLVNDELVASSVYVEPRCSCCPMKAVTSPAVTRVRRSREDGPVAQPCRNDGGSRDDADSIRPEIAVVRLDKIISRARGSAFSPRT
jgi:hypothetical protein